MSKSEVNKLFSEYAESRSDSCLNKLYQKAFIDFSYSLKNKTFIDSNEIEDLYQNAFLRVISRINYKIDDFSNYLLTTAKNEALEKIAKKNGSIELKLLVSGTLNCSKEKAKKYIYDGKITLNGIQELNPDKKVSRNQSFSLDDSEYQSKFYLADTTINDNVYLISDRLDPESILMEDVQKEIVRNFIETLPDEQKEVVKMRYFEDMSLKEVAELKNVSINTIKSREKYAKDAIRLQVEQFQKENFHFSSAIPYTFNYKLSIFTKVIAYLKRIFKSSRRN